jgi:predicted nucleotidyltransferase
MDLIDPTRAVTPTLDGPVLSVLASAGRPLTAGEVALLTVRGSEIGVRRSLARLVEQGIVRTTEIGRTRVHELNRDHIAAPIAVLLADLRNEMWRRLRETLGKWKVRPVYAAAFGSAARQSGSPDSDVDLLLVHPAFPGDKAPGRSTNLAGVLGTLALDMSLPLMSERDAETWTQQIDRLRQLVLGWTGNHLQVIDVSPYEWADGRGARASIFEEIERDAVVLVQARSLAGAAKSLRTSS